MDIVEFACARLEHLRNARLSRDEIELRQLAKFRRLVAHAVAHAPFYRDVVTERRIDVAQCHPADFPELTKTLLMENFDRIVTDPAITRGGIEGFLHRSHDPLELYGGKYYVVHTSGTSGEVGYFVYSPSDWSRGAAQALRVNPPALRRRKLAFFGAIHGHFVGVSLMATTRKWPMRYLFESETFDINMPLAPILARLTQFQPDILMGYPSALVILAERQQAGAMRIAPRFVQTSGEALTPADRARIEQTFGVPVRNVYACTEHLVVGFAQPDFDGMYLFEDDLIFELATDHTLVTNLFNYTLPLIRYRMGDVLLPKPDSVGAYPFRKVAEIVGRRELTPIFTNRYGTDDFISPHVVSEFFVKNLRRFQLVIRSKTACTMRAVLAPGLDEDAKDATLAEVRDRFRALLAQKEMDNVAVEVEERDDLRPDAKTGKFRLIVNA